MRLNGRALAAAAIAVCVSCGGSLPPPATRPTAPGPPAPAPPVPTGVDVPPPPADQLLGKAYRARPEAAAAALEAAAAVLEAIGDWDAASIEGALRGVATDLGEKPGDMFMLCRVVVTGKAVTPPLFESMELVGDDRCLARLHAAADAVRATAG